MIRHCDGTDPNLIRTPREAYSAADLTRYIPCDCGLRFDDVDHSVIYPHERFGTKLTLPEQENMLIELGIDGGLSGPPRPIRHSEERIIHDPSLGMCLVESATKGPLIIVHICVHFAGHVKLRRHRCRCNFTWADDES